MMLLYIEWINNKILLYSTGNCIQHPVISHNEKEFLKECIYIYVCVCVCVLYMCVCMRVFVCVCVCASLIAQLVKNLPAMQETPV